MGKSSSTSETTYKKTTTQNPYAIAQTNNKGTQTSLKDGTALSTVYDFVNNNINSLLDEYLTPNLNSVTNQAKLNAFTSNLNSNAARSLENNIISPLSQRNMIRSSQATDLYKNLNNKTTDTLASFINELLAESQNNTANMINNLLKAYMQGYSVISDMQKQSLATSKGNAKITTTGSNDYITPSISAASALL